MLEIQQYTINGALPGLQRLIPVVCYDRCVIKHSTFNLISIISSPTAAPSEVLHSSIDLFSEWIAALVVITVVVVLETAAVVMAALVVMTAVMVDGDEVRQ